MASVEAAAGRGEPNGRYVRVSSCSTCGDQTQFSVPIPSGHPDVTKISIPFMLVMSLLMASIAGAFHIGGLYTDINRERSEVLHRLDGIEMALGKLLPGYAMPDRKAKAH